MRPPVETLLEPYLKRGERILWRGAPAPGFGWRAGELILMALGVVFVGVTFAFMPLNNGEMIFGGLFFVAGLAMFVPGLLAGWWVRRRSCYALTNRRAFLIFDHPVAGPRLRDYPVNSRMGIDKTKTRPASVYFAGSDWITVNNRPMRLGFARIAEADLVYELMRDVRDGKA